SPLWLLCLLFYSETVTTAIYPLSLHDALPISARRRARRAARPARRRRRSRRGSRGSLLLPRAAHAPSRPGARRRRAPPRRACPRDRKSTRLNSSHVKISYAVFCLKKKNTTAQQ